MYPTLAARFVPAARLAACCGLVLTGGCASLAVDLVVSNVTVYTGEAASPFVATVAVDDGRFVAIDRTQNRRFRAAEITDGEGLYMTPGLWDMHVHVANAETNNIDVEAFLDHGVTSVRDCGGFPAQIDAMRTAIAAGERDGPTIYTVGPTLNGESFAPFQRVLATEEEVKAAVDELAESGVQMLKIHRAFDPALLPALLEAAHARGLAVMGHIPLGMSPLDACELGMDGVEHLGSFVEAYASVAPEEGSAGGIAYMQSDAAAPLYECLARRGVEVTPTLVVYPAVARARIGDAPMPPDFFEFIKAMERIALRLHGAGVALLTGTDTASTESSAIGIAPGSSLLDELEMLAASGIAARDIIVMATSNAARTLGVDAQTGSIALGKAADFLLLEADPGADVANFRRLQAAYKGGERLAAP